MSKGSGPKRTVFCVLVLFLFGLEPSWADGPTPGRTSGVILHEMFLKAAELEWGKDTCYIVDLAAWLRTEGPPSERSLCYRYRDVLPLIQGAERSSPVRLTEEDRQADARFESKYPMSLMFAHRVHDRLHGNLFWRCKSVRSFRAAMN